MEIYKTIKELIEKSTLVEEFQVKSHSPYCGHTIEKYINGNNEYELIFNNGSSFITRDKLIDRWVVGYASEVTKLNNYIKFKAFGLVNNEKFKWFEWSAFDDEDFDTLKEIRVKKMGDFKKFGIIWERDWDNKTKDIDKDKEKEEFISNNFICNNFKPGEEITLETLKGSEFFVNVDGELNLIEFEKLNEVQCYDEMFLSEDNTFWITNNKFLKKKVKCDDFHYDIESKEIWIMVTDADDLEGTMLSAVKIE